MAKEYCEDDCPLHGAITIYNLNHLHNICCTSDFCQRVIDTIAANKGINYYEETCGLAKENKNELG